MRSRRRQAPARLRPRSDPDSESVPAEAEWGVVVRVADGDTLTVQFDDGEEETIRSGRGYAGNRASDPAEECYGAQASDFTKTLMGQRVRIEEEGRDRYGRLLAYVWTTADEGGSCGTSACWRRGLAVYNDYGNPGQYRTQRGRRPSRPCWPGWDCGPPVNWRRGPRPFPRSRLRRVAHRDVSTSPIHHAASRAT